MKLFKRLTLAAGLTLWAAASHAAGGCDATAGNLVRNCGFESGSFSSWTLSGNDVPQTEGNLYGVEVGTDPDGYAPHGGVYQAYFGDGVANATTLAQTLSTKAGDSYLISFYVAQDGGPPDGAYTTPHLTASFGGTALASVSAVPLQGYTAYTFTAKAGAASSLFSLTLGNDTGYFLVDDVSVVDRTSPVPEPAPWLMMAGGLLTLGLAGRRRRAVARR